MSNSGYPTGWTKSGLAPRRTALVAATACATLLLILTPGCVTTQPQMRQKAKESAPVPHGEAPIQIPWAFQKTVQTDNIYGYNVYRSDNPERDFKKINDDLIVPSPDNPNPQFVTYFDRGLPVGSVYYYYVEAVLQNGTKRKATPVAPLRITREMTTAEFKKWQNEQAEKKKEKNAGEKN